MKADPFIGDVKPVKGLRGVFRRRIGDYRIIFTVDFEEDTIVIFRIGSREKVYEKVKVYDFCYFSNFTRI
ncbi:MAG: type II toxin-antitoxin system RelE/ParE family toxin [Nitrososphaerota archaeon]